MNAARDVKYVVLDFDGTFTDVEKEGSPFTRAFQEYFSDLIGKDEDLVRDVWRIAEKRVRAEPDRFGGFEESARIVAPPSDPYLRANAVARILCQRFQVLRNPQLRNDVIQSVFRMAYRQTGTSFQDAAASVLDELLGRKGITVAIVTNSSRPAVLEKLGRLDLKNRTETNPLVVGDAHKFGVLAQSPEPLGRLPELQTDQLPVWKALYERIPEELVAPGLSRPIYLRRGSYFRVLRDHVWKEDTAGPARTLVCGDIYELDLALPAALDAHVHLVTREDTPRHEIDIVGALERGGVSADLRGVLERLG
jgi:FMN phosphatase YigB (HAD superfamily)